jgi:hypothetical protein
MTLTERFGIGGTNTFDALCSFPQSPIHCWQKEAEGQPRTGLGEHQMSTTNDKGPCWGPGESLLHVSSGRMAAIPFATRRASIDAARTEQYEASTSGRGCAH